MEVADITINIIVCLPDDITVIIVCPDGAADVVVDDRVAFTILYNYTELSIYTDFTSILNPSHKLAKYLETI